MKRFCRIALVAALALWMPWTAAHADSATDFDRARTLYENTMYVQAMDLFQSLPQYKSDALVDGYVCLCSIKLQVPGYEDRALEYLQDYHTTTLGREIHLCLASDYFEKERYADALKHYVQAGNADLAGHMEAEYLFKKGYCRYMLDGKDVGAWDCFAAAEKFPSNDYTAPSQYLMGYIRYCDADFAQAAEWFEKSSVDERFSSISQYYIVVCRYQMKDYDYVLQYGEPMLENLPEDRKEYLSRMVSESYLVKGDKKNARRLFSQSDKDSSARGDLFYAGSLMFATGDWKAAVENYARMEDKTDSLGQIAWYQSALSQIQLKNKVAALDAFKKAAFLPFDAKMTEDAYFNYAKLSFDLNGDTSVFSDYLNKFADKVRGEKIYSYMALACLSDRKYQAAIDYYDKIDSLSGKEKSNYIKANYLRGAELLSSGAYRGSIQCFQAVTYYLPAEDAICQLARLSLGEAHYRNRQWQEAAAQYTALYNISAFEGQSLCEVLPYNVAYSHFKNEDWTQAQRWFEITLTEGAPAQQKDALTRKADCIFARKDYKGAIDAYQAVLDKYYDVNDIYPYYQCALCCGLSRNATKNRKEAKKLLQREIQLLESVLQASSEAPLYSEALFELGKVQQSEKMGQSALKTFAQLIGTSRDSSYIARATLETGTVKRSLKDIEGALACYKKVVEQMPRSACVDDALLAIESIYQSTHQPQLYLAYLESIGRSSSKSEEDKEDMIFSAAQQIFYSDNFENALEAFRQFEEQYPNSSRKSQADYYRGECYRSLGDKQQACDCYALVMNEGGGSFRESATSRYAALCYSMDNFAQAFSAYDNMLSIASTPQLKSEALIGKMRSAFRFNKFEDAIQCSADVQKDPCAADDVKREARMLRAKSLLSLSRREEAYAVLSDLALNPKTEEGAQAAFMVIQDLYDNAKFDAVIDKVHALAESGTSQQYYLAKAFIVLGDVYAEQGKLKQARATFQSIASEYTLKDEILPEVSKRLERLSQMQNNQ